MSVVSVTKILCCHNVKMFQFLRNFEPTPSTLPRDPTGRIRSPNLLGPQLPWVTISRIATDVCGSNRYQ